MRLPSPHLMRPFPSSTHRAIASLPFPRGASPSSAFRDCAERPQPSPTISVEAQRAGVFSIASASRRSVLSPYPRRTRCSDRLVFARGRRSLPAFPRALQPRNIRAAGARREQGAAVTRRRPRLRGPGHLTRSWTARDGAGGGVQPDDVQLADREGLAKATRSAESRLAEADNSHRLKHNDLGGDRFHG